MALDASRRLADRPAQALSHHALGYAFVQLSSYDRACTHLEDALSCSRNSAIARAKPPPERPGVDARSDRACTGKRYRTPRQRSS